MGKNLYFSQTAALTGIDKIMTLLTVIYDAVSATVTETADAARRKEIKSLKCAEETGMRLNAQKQNKKKKEIKKQQQKNNNKKKQTDRQQSLSENVIMSGF